MKDLRQEPSLRDLAAFAERIATESPLPPRRTRATEITELRRRGATLADGHGSSVDLAELAATFEDTPDHRAELARSAREILKRPLNPMNPRMKSGIGWYLVSLGITALAVLPWAWSLAMTTIGSTQSAAIAKKGGGKATEAHFLWLTFTPTTDTMLMIIVILMAIIGSVAVLMLTFSNRAGHETIEQGYLWWYLTRPITAAGIAAIFYMAIAAGYFNQVTGEGRAALVIAAAVGGFAGLFSDKVLKMMRSILGQKPFDAPAAEARDEASPS
jgi:hypothetical protein